MISEIDYTKKLAELKVQEFNNEIIEEFKIRLSNKILDEIVSPIIKDYVEAIAKDLSYEITKKFNPFLTDEQIIFNWVMKDKK